MSQDEKDNPSVYVRVEDCRERHEALMTHALKTDSALFGENGRGGIVKDISDIRTDIRVIKENLKGSLSGKDKAAIIAAVIVAVASIIVALLK